MKPIKYGTIAHILRAYFFLLAIFCCLTTIISFVFAVFETPAMIKYEDGSTFEIGGFSSGIPVKTSISLSIPKMIIKGYSQTGQVVSTQNIYENNEELPKNPPAFRQDTLFNKFESIENPDKVKFLRIDPIASDIVTRVETSSIKLRLFWIIYDGLERLFWIFICIIMIKIINAYLNNKILRPRTFKLINYLGWGFVITTPVIWVFTFANTKITPSFYLDSQNMNGDTLNNFTLSLQALNSMYFGNILIGFMILVLSQVIKEAVLVKKEIEFTI